MSWDRTRETAIFRLRGGRKQFEERNIALPKTVLDALAVFDRIDAEMPKARSHTALREAILAGASQEELDALLLADLGAQRMLSEYTQARVDAALRALGAIRRAHDDIYPQLKTLADKQIQHIEKVAALGGVELPALVRAGRHDEAQALATVDVAAAELSELYNLRDVYLSDNHGTAVGVIDCGRWRDPRPVFARERGDESLSEALLNGVRAGGELWFPSQAEAVDQAERIHAAERKRQDQQEEAAAQFI